MYALALLRSHPVAARRSWREVEDVPRRPLEPFPGRGDSMIAHGMNRGGRYLKVIYSPDDKGDGIFVITAFDLPDKQVRALKRRTKRRKRR